MDDDKKTFTMTLNLGEGDSQILETLSALDECGKTEWTRLAIRSYAPLSVLLRRDPGTFHRIMAVAHRLASSACWGPNKKINDEQSAVRDSEVIDNVAVYLRQEAKDALRAIESGASITLATNNPEPVE